MYARQEYVRICTSLSRICTHVMPLPLKTSSLASDRRPISVGKGPVSPSPDGRAPLPRSIPNTRSSSGKRPPSGQLACVYNRKSCVSHTKPSVHQTSKNKRLTLPRIFGYQGRFGI